MPEILVNRAPAFPELRRRIRQSVAQLEPGLQIVAEDVLGQVSRIDLIGCDTKGSTVVILISSDPTDDALLTRGLAQRAWLEPRRADWLKLAPELAIDPEQPVRVWLIAPSFGSELCAAAEALGPDIMGLATCRYLQTENQRSVLLEVVTPRRTATKTTPETQEQPPDPTSDPALAPFRSGLEEQDLIARTQAPSARTGRY